MIHIEMWMCWLAVALLAILVKLFSKEYFSLGIAIGAIATASADFIGFNDLKLLIAIFVVVSLVAAASLQPYAMRKEAERREKLQQSRIPHFGKEAVVAQAIDNMAGKGTVTIDGQDHPARAAEGFPIDSGTTVIVVNNDGPKLLVRIK